MNFAVTIWTTPIAQPRPRAVAPHGRAMIVSNPGKSPVAAYKKIVAVEARTFYKGPLLAQPLRVTLLFVMPRPKSVTRKTRPNPRLRHTSKPDIENLAKSTLDALTGIVWEDDCWICELELEKVVARGGESPHVNVFVETLSEELP